MKEVSDTAFSDAGPLTDELLVKIIAWHTPSRPGLWNDTYLLGKELQHARQCIEAIYLALNKLNIHHSHEHHLDDPEMPADLTVAEGYLAYRKATAYRNQRGTAE